MKIAVNLWVLKDKQKEGIGWFTYHTVMRLIKAHPEVEFHLLTSFNFNEKEFQHPNAKVHKLFPNRRHPFLYLIYLNYVVPIFLRSIKPDLFLSPDGMLSLYTKVPQLAVIHDINFIHFPGDLKWYNSWFYNKYFPEYARKATRIATVSEYSKNDIVKHLNIDPLKIDVVYNGINDFFVTDAVDINNTQNEHLKPLLGRKYFLFIGSLNPRKNIERLIEAYEKFRGQHNDVLLVIAGANGWLLKNIKNAYASSQWKDDIILTGRLADSDLKLLLSNALALTFVPYFEGFGIPIVEAMAVGVPVLTSNVTSLPEVAGDAAIMVDPYNADAIAVVMGKLYTDHMLRDELIRKGKQRAMLFSWDRTAGLLWKSILSV